MKVKVQNITEYMDGKNAHFMIPVYQRNYDWNAKEQCKVLGHDLEKISNSETLSPHFFGAIVRVVDSSTGDWIIIDGQQRLTTVSLLMLAIAHKAEEIERFNPTAILPSRQNVLDLCLDFKKKQKLKLKLLRNDMQAYECLANKQSCPEYNKSKVIQCYRLFYESLDADNINKIYEATKSLQIVDILLDSKDDNPQLVFESLNSKGLDLSVADKIRNYILIGLDYETQESLYFKYWEPMEKKVGTDGKDVSDYIWRYLQNKSGIVGSGNLYNDFKTYVLNRDTESLLQDILSMATIYHDLRTQQVGVNRNSELTIEINKKITNILEKLQIHTTLPFLMEVVDKYYKDEIQEQDLLDVLCVLESYLIRYGLLHVSSTLLNSLFVRMKKDINDILDKVENAKYSDVFRFVLDNLSKIKPNASNPKDDDIKEFLTTKDVYNSRRKLCKFILDAIELSSNPKEVVDIRFLTIEHIMPQKLSGPDGEQWKGDLGDTWELIHEKFLHTIGNLTLTGYNPEYGNRSFHYKKNIQGGFNNSPLYLNSFMKNTDVWTEKQIIERGNILARRMLSLYPIYKPSRDYSIQQNITSITLANDRLEDVIMHRKPTKALIGFFDEDIELYVSSWKDLYLQLINALYNSEHKSDMEQAFRFGNNGKFTGIISKVEEKRGAKGEILWQQIIPESSIYFHTTKSSVDMCVAIKIWLEYLKLSADDIEIYLR